MKIIKHIELIVKKLNDMTHPQIILSGFAIAIFLGTILLMLPVSTADGQGAAPLTALFTSTSAVCVTGLVVVDTGTYFSFFGQIVILILIQIGGLGFMALATLLFLITGKKISVKSRMLMKTSFSTDSLQGIVRYVKYVMAFTFIVETCGALLLSGVFIPAYGISRGIFMSIFHSISAFCNAGFDIIGGGVSFMPFATNVLLNITVCALIVIGGIGFAVAMEIISKKKFSLFDLNTKVVLIATGSLILLGAAVVFFCEYTNPKTIGEMPFLGKILASFFTSITPRTAGFNTIDMAVITAPTKLIIMIFMFIGGSPGSTAGGVKTTTISIFIFAMIRTMQGYDEVNVFNRHIGASLIKRALAIAMLGLIWVIVAVMIIKAIEPVSMGNILFEVLSAFGTVGLSTGITAGLSPVSKLTLILTMFSGRVGFMTVAYAMSRKTEMKRSMGSYKYPDGNLLL